MGRLLRNRWLLGGLFVVAIAVVSVSTFVFQGRDGGQSGGSAQRGASALAHSTTTSSSTTTSTTTTTTAPPPTAPPAPAPEPAPAPVAIAPPPPAPAPACDGPDSPVIDAMNGDRASAGLGGLCGNGQLASYAQAWANTMAQNHSLTHQDLNGILAGTSFNTVAENILDGPGGLSVGQMETAWMNSPAHRENIMNGVYGAAGVGIAYSSDGMIWVCVDFGG